MLYKDVLDIIFDYKEQLETEEKKKKWREISNELKETYEYTIFEIPDLRSITTEMTHRKNLKTKKLTTMINTVNKNGTGNLFISSKTHSIKELYIRKKNKYIFEKNPDAISQIIFA